MTISKFYFVDNCEGYDTNTALTLDREAFTVSSPKNEPVTAHLSGYDLTVETKPGVWKRRTVRVDLDEVAAAGMKILEVRGMKEGSREVHIETDQGTLWMYHPQECCEWVELVDVAGDPEDLVGGTIVVFEHRTEEHDINKMKGHLKKMAKIKPYSFYAIRTTKGDITLRWEKVNDVAYGTDVIVRFKDA